MRRDNPSPAVLEGLDAIAAYLGKSRTTIWRWIIYDNFPATKLPSGTWFTTKYIIANWILAGHDAEIEARKVRRMENSRDVHCMDTGQ